MKGYAFSPDGPWQKDFENAFIYEDTDSQIKATAEIKEDMEKEIPMDRLLLGDVGYGKTEVAIRAAFKAVTDSKQVAFLVPTTILAQQHFNTIKERLKDYPVNVEMISRFRTASQQKKILEDLKKGKRAAAQAEKAQYPLVHGNRCIACPGWRTVAPDARKWLRPGTDRF